LRYPPGIFARFCSPVIAQEIYGEDESQLARQARFSRFLGWSIELAFSGSSITSPRETDR
jgi:hypothetical protein